MADKTKVVGVIAELAKAKDGALAYVVVNGRFVEVADIWHGLDYAVIVPKTDDQGTETTTG